MPPRFISKLVAILLGAKSCLVGVAFQHLRLAGDITLDRAQTGHVCRMPDHIGSVAD